MNKQFRFIAFFTLVAGLSTASIHASSPNPKIIGGQGGVYHGDINTQGGIYHGGNGITPSTSSSATSSKAQTAPATLVSAIQNDDLSKLAQFKKRHPKFDLTIKLKFPANKKKGIPAKVMTPVQAAQTNNSVNVASDIQKSIAVNQQRSTGPVSSIATLNSTVDAVGVGSDLQ